MKKIILSIAFFIAIVGVSYSQVITPFTVRKTITQKGGILYLSNTSSKAVPDNAVQNEMPPSGTGYDNNFTNGYVDIDGDSSTFMSSSDKISIPSGDTNAYSLCSEISWAGLYWGGAINSANTNYAARNQVKLKINSGSYVTLNADYLKDNAIGFKTYHCFKDITSYVNVKGLSDTFTVANVVNDIGAKNLFGGWTIVIVYKDNTTTMKNLTVFDGLANVSSGTYSTVDIPISGFQTPLSGPVNFQLGLVVYDGDRSLTGDQLMFKGASSFINLSDAIHPSTDMFNSTLSRNGVLTTQRNPSYNNTLGYDANIFYPDNSGKNYIGNNAISATIRQTTGGETFLTQVVTSAIDVYEPDMRSAVTVENITHPAATVASPGDILEYTVSGLNIGSDPAINSYITDKIEGNAFYVPNSISITEGPNAGALTDAAGDDQAEYIAATKTVKVRIGTGANSFQGGQINNSPTGIDHTLIKFRVQISTDCVYMYCDNVVDNSAHITGTGNISGNIFDNASNPGVFDTNGCAISGTTTTPVNITGCSAPTVSVNSPICSGGTINLFATNSASATYLWTGPNGFTSTSSSPSISNATVANSGTYTVTISVTGTSCKFINTVNVDVNIANAGQDLTGSSTCGVTAVTLAGNNPTGSTGEWTIVSGSGGSFGSGHTTTSSVYNSSFNGVTDSSYVLRWSLSSPGCPTTTDDVTITFHSAPTLAVLSGASANCNNNLNVAITGGTPPYTLNINNGVGTINNYTSGTTISVNPSVTTTYTLLSITDANGCSPASISPNTYQIVITNSLGTGTITANNAPVVTSSNTGVTVPTVGSSTSTTDPWLNPTNIYASDNVYATETKTSTGNGSSYLYAKGYGFNIPTNAVIDGIIVNVEKKSSGGTIIDSRISLTSNGTSGIGSNKTISGNWPTADAVSVYGTATDIWGTTTSNLTPTIINNANFGIRYRVSFSTANAIAYIDYTSMTIYYHVGSTSYCDTDSGKNFTVSGFSNATNYTWTPPTGATVTAGQGTTTATIDFNGAGQVGSYPLTVTPSNSCGSGTAATISLPIIDCANASLAIIGNVYKDVNGSTAPQKVDGTGVGIVNGTQLYVTLVKTNGTAAFVQTLPVATDGSFSFSTSISQSNTYSITLSTTNYTSGTNPTATLPSGCSNNGEIKNTITNSTTGNDGTIDGKITAITFSAANNITNVNFGIKIPTAPVANNDAIVTDEDIPVSFNVVSNDTDVDGTVNATTVDLNTTTTGIQNTITNSSGTWSVTTAGVVTFTPTANFNGIATLAYKVNDNDALTSNAATITVTVNPVNDAPSGTASSVTATENAPYTFATADFNYTDLESNLSTAIVIKSLPSKGTLTYNGTAVLVGQIILNASISNLIYTPNTDEFGTPYTTFSFSVNDASTGTVSGTMTINVNHVNVPPVAVNDLVSTIQNTSVSFNILTNDTNNDGTITNTSVDLDPLTTGQQTSFTLPGEGTFTNNGSGVITFVPNSAFFGTTTEINYTVNNSYSLTSNIGSIFVTVIPAGAPTAVNDTTATTSINTPVVFSVVTNDVATNPRTINASRVDLDPNTVGIQQSYYVANKGQFSVDMNGDVTFVPDWNYSGVTTIYYTVKDSQNLISNIATITATTSWANTAPFASDDFITTNEDTATTLNIISNDYDLDTAHGNSGILDGASVDLDPNTIGTQTSFTVDGQGVFTVNSSGVVTFTPVLNYNGEVTPIQYTVNDKDASPLTSNIGYIYTTINAVNDAPVATNDVSNAMISGTATSITISAISNDSDIDGTIDPTSVDLDPFTAGQQFSFSVLGQGTYTADNLGNITFTYTSVTPVGPLTPVSYTVKDNNGLVSNIATITITVLAGTPTAVNDDITTTEDVALSYDVTSNDTDVNGILIGINPSTVTLVGTTTTSAGTWSITDAVNNPGEVTFTPAANFFGSTSVNYTVTDLDGTISNQATITITISSVNDVPSFTKGANQSVCKNSGAQTVTGWATALSAGPANESSQIVSFVVSNNLNSLFSSQPSIDAVGNLTYTIAANQTGTATVTVQIQDDGGTANGGINISASQTFTILVSVPSVAGTITGATTVCTGTNSTTLTSTGATGTRQWQSSTDNSNFTNIGGATSSTYVAANLTVTTYYQVVVTSGSCASATTPSVKMTVSPVSVAGSITGATAVCSGTNSTILTLSGNTGTIQWQSSNALAGTYTAIVGATSSTYTVTNISAATYYRAVVTSGSCTSATTTSVAMTISPAPVAGSITGATTVCSGSNSTTLSLSGNTGSIQWQSSSDNSNFTNIIGATSLTYTATNLTATTYYRAVVTNCTSVTTTSVTITVNPVSVAGSISGATTVCTGTNSTILTLSGNTGSIQWQSSNALAGTYTDISGATSATYTATNLTATTYYRALVTNGICTSATTTSVTITVNPVSVAGSITGATTVCSGTNSTILTLTGNTGSIQWQSSSNNTTFNTIAGATSSTYTATNLNVTGYYRAIVTNGVCTSATTSSVTITVTSSVTGSVSGEATVCTGTNSTVLTLAGNTGTIQWQSSSNNITFNNISGQTGSTYTATNLTATTYYRAAVTNGGCTSATTASAAVTVTPDISSIVLSNISGVSLAPLGAPMTLSVTPIVGAVSYIWDLPAGMVIASSTFGGANVVINVANNFAGGTVSVKAINACSSTGWKSKIYANPALAGIIISSSYTGAPIICGGATNVPFNVTNTTGATYLWSLPSGVSLSSGSIGTASSVYLDFASNYQGGSISVTSTTATASNIAYYTVGAIAAPANLNGPSVLCGLTTATYTVTSVTNAISYEWSLPSGMTITSGSGTIMIQTSLTGSVSGYVRVRALGSCGYSAWNSIWVGGTAMPTFVSGPSMICGAAIYTITDTTMTSVSQNTLNYNVTAVAGVNYTWSVPTGMTITSGQGTNAIVVTVVPENFVSGQITVIAVDANNSTCTSLPRYFNVTKGASAITGPTALCNLTTATYSVPSASGSAFTWSVPTWMTIASGQGTNQINVTIANTGTSAQTMSLSLTTSCGTQELSTTVGCGLYTQLTNAFCGQTLPSIGSGIAATIVSGATGYSFSIVYNGQTYTVVSPDCWITLSEAVGMPLVYGATYAISVSIQYGNQWGSYGSVCNVTTPSIPTTQLTSTYCGQTLLNLNSGIAATIIPSVTSYTFSIVYNNVTYTVISPDCWITLSEATGMPLVYGATYAVSVKVQNAGVWGNYGSACNVTTPGIPTTQLTSAFCGQMLPSIGSGIAATIIPSASSYTFSILYNNVTYTVVSPDCWITLSEAVGMPLVYGATYAVSVKVQNSGVWGNYGSACNVTTPGIPTTQLTSAFCGQMLPSIGSGIAATIIPSASSYTFSIVYNNVTYTVVSPDCWITLSEAVGMPLVYGATYAVSVKVQNSGVWGNYGSTCNVTTPSIPTTQLTSTYCGQTLLNLNSGIAATIIPSASSYSFSIVYNNVTYTVVSPDCWITLSEATGMPLVYGATYAVSVKVQNSGVWGNYGSACNVTTPGIPTTQLTSAFCGQMLPSIGSAIAATIIPSASSYTFSILYNNVTYTVVSSDCWITLSEAVGMPLVYGATYAVSVKVQNAGVWGNYGSVCSVTTATNATTTQLQTSQCDYTAVTSTEMIHATLVNNATNYRFSFTNTALAYGYVFDTNNLGSFGLDTVPGLLSATTYSVKVSVQIGGVWGAYGKACTLTTPGIAKTIAPMETVTLFDATAYPNPFAENFKLNVKTSSQDTLQVKVYDMLGKLLENQILEASQIEEFEIGANYPTGVYNVIVSQGDNLKTLRVIKR